GPAGLAAAVYGASVALDTVLVERFAIGGQAGTSSRIENYLGCPGGISGTDLARKAHDQARKFGAEILTAAEATSIRLEEPIRSVCLADGTEIRARAVLVATGMTVRTIDAPGFDRLDYAGVYYGATPSEANSFKGEEVAVIGGATSAGQAALMLSRTAAHVTIVVRAPALEAKMSTYLVDQIRATPNIEVLTGSQVVEALGEDHLTGMVIAREDGTRQTRPVAGLFILIGAVPHTGFLRGVVQLNEAGFVLTGPDLVTDGRPPPGWPLKRLQYMLETSVPGIFAAGDVRQGSIRRVAAAVGSGAASMTFIHEYSPRCDRDPRPPAGRRPLHATGRRRAVRPRRPRRSRRPPRRPRAFLPRRVRRPGLRSAGRGAGGAGARPARGAGRSRAGPRRPGRRDLFDPGHHPQRHGRCPLRLQAGRHRPRRSQGGDRPCRERPDGDPPRSVGADPQPGCEGRADGPVGHPGRRHRPRAQQPGGRRAPQFPGAGRDPATAGRGDDRRGARRPRPGASGGVRPGAGGGGGRRREPRRSLRPAGAGQPRTAGGRGDRPSRDRRRLEPGRRRSRRRPRPRSHRAPRGHLRHGRGAGGGGAGGGHGVRPSSRPGDRLGLRPHVQGRPGSRFLQPGGGGARPGRGPDRRAREEPVPPHPPTRRHRGGPRI